MRIDTLALAVGGIGFLGFGLIMLIAPQSAMAGIGISLPEGAASTEIRACYGGLELGLGALLLAALRADQYRRAGLILGLVCYGAVASARVFGMLVDGGSSAFIWGALAVEAGLATLYAWTLRRP